MSAADAWKRQMPRVGQKAERSRGIEPEHIRLFTEISGDRNPLHYDEQAARASRFGEIVVQGGVTSAIQVRADKPITKLKTSVRRQDGVVVLEGTAVCYTMALGASWV